MSRVEHSFGVVMNLLDTSSLMDEDFPVPMSIGSDLEMTLIDGETKILLTLWRRGITWKRDLCGRCATSRSPTSAEWRFHHVGLFATRARDVTEAPPLDAAKRDVTLYEKAMTR